MSQAKDLYILSIFGGSALGIRNDVIKVEVLLTSAFHTTSLISFPYFDLYGRRYHPIVINSDDRGHRKRLKLV